MQNLKKLLALLLALVMVFSMMTVLTACDDQGGDSESDDDKKEEKEEKFEPQVVYDDNDVKVTFNGTKKRNGTYTLKFNIQNNSSRTIDGSLTAFTVNGYRMDVGSNYNLESESDDDFTIEIGSYYMEMCDIQKINTLLFDLVVYKEDSYDIQLQETISIELSENDQTYNDEGTEILNKDGIRVVLKEYVLTNDGSLLLTHYIENISDQDIYIYCDNFLVNGCMMPYANAFYGTLRSGERYIASGYISDLHLIGIESKNDIQNFSGNIFASEYESNETFLWEPYELALGDGDYTFEPKNVTVLFDEDNFQLAYQKTVDLNGVPCLLFFAKFDNPDEPSFDLVVTEVNGEEYYAYGFYSYSTVADIYCIPMQFYLGEDAPVDSFEDVKTITITITFRDPNYDFVTHEITFDIP